MKVTLTESKIKQLIRESIKDAIYNSYPKPLVRLEVNMPYGGIQRSEGLNIPEITKLYEQIPEEERIPAQNIKHPIFNSVHSDSVKDWNMLVNDIVYFCDTKEDVETLLEKILIFDRYIDKDNNPFEMPFHVEASMNKGRKFKATDAGPEHDIEQNVQFINATIYYDMSENERERRVPKGFIHITVYDESDQSSVWFWQGR